MTELCVCYIPNTTQQSSKQSCSFVSERCGSVQSVCFHAAGIRLHTGTERLSLLQQTSCSLLFPADLMLSLHSKWFPDPVQLSCWSITFFCYDSTSSTPFRVELLTVWRSLMLTFDYRSRDRRRWRFPLSVSLSLYLLSLCLSALLCILLTLSSTL